MAGACLDDRRFGTFPVQPGERSAKVYLTNLFSTVLPLIRFEITDEITVIAETCPCGSAHTWIDDVQGRLDDTLLYPGGLAVHPIMVRSPLGRQRNVAEYQVHQTCHGLDVLTPDGRIGGESSGKVKRIVPLPAIMEPARVPAPGNRSLESPERPLLGTERG